MAKGHDKKGLFDDLSEVITPRDAKPEKVVCTVAIDTDSFECTDCPGRRVSMKSTPNYSKKHTLRT